MILISTVLTDPPLWRTDGRAIAYRALCIIICCRALKTSRKVVPGVVERAKWTGTASMHMWYNIWLETKVLSQINRLRLPQSNSRVFVKLCKLFGWVLTCRWHWVMIDESPWKYFLKQTQHKPKYVENRTNTRFIQIYETETARELELVTWSNSKN